MGEFKTLPQHVLEQLTDAVKNILHPSFYEHTLREIGANLGREVVGHVRRSHVTALPFQQEDYSRCLSWMQTHWGWNHEVKVAKKSLIHISIPQCPFGKHAADDPHICQIEAGMLGGIAGDQFNYSKVEICRGAGIPPKDCSLTVHLERTAQSMIAEGPTFPLISLGAKPTQTVDAHAQVLSRLSPREKHIMKLIGEGFSDREIANALRISVRTVEGHAARIRNKTGLRTRRNLIRLELLSKTSL